MFADKQAKAIFCAKAGYGAIRTIPYLDRNIIRRNPKFFVGYSDITVIYPEAIKPRSLDRGWKPRRDSAPHKAENIGNHGLKPSGASFSISVRGQGFALRIAIISKIKICFAA